MQNPSYTINLEVPKKKRGRPAKSINKEEQRVIDTFAETLSELFNNLACFLTSSLDGKRVSGRFLKLCECG